MSATKVFTPMAEQSFADLADVRNALKASVSCENTNHYNIMQLESAWGACQAWLDAEKVYSLSKSYWISTAVMTKIVCCDTGQQTGTEEWPVALEFAGEADDACIDFCNSHGLIPELRKCINQIHAIFSNIKSVYAELDYFEEDYSNEDGHIVLRLEVASDTNIVSQEYKAWVDWVVCNIDVKSIGLFTLTIRRV